MIGPDAGPRDRFESVDVPGAGVNIRAHWARGGDTRPLVLLHGFPGHWTAWLPLAERLLDAGRTVWIPELRGYGASDRPSERRAYRLDLLAGDVERIVLRAGAPAVLVGHDWGGPLAWRLAEERPELVHRLIAINGPPSGLMARAVRRPSQAVRSSYILLFLIPGIAEWILNAANQWALRAIFGDFAETSDGHAALDELRDPGALTAALDYYRANLGIAGRSRRQTSRVRVPVLALWGSRDPALGTAMLHHLPDFAETLTVHVLDSHAHWLQTEAPERVAAEIVDFLDLSGAS